MLQSIIDKKTGTQQKKGWCRQLQVQFQVGHLNMPDTMAMLFGAFTRVLAASITCISFQGAIR